MAAGCAIKGRYNMKLGAGKDAAITTGVVSVIVFRLLLAVTTAVNVPVRLYVCESRRPWPTVPSPKSQV